MTSLPWQPFFDTALAAVEAGAAVLRQHWGSLLDIRNKGYAGDLVTEADRQSEAVIIAHLQQAYPSHAVLGEESGNSGGGTSEFLWVLDPLDGTTNYAHGHPFVAISLALLYQQKPVVGIVYNPFLEELFTAIQDEGAFLNGQRLQVSSVVDLSHSLLASGFAYDRRHNPDNNYAAFCLLTHLTQGVRRCGAASLDLAYVAAGRLEGYWERGVKAWDLAAGVLLVQEAGGALSDYDATQPFDLRAGRILATNGLIHKALSELLLHPIPISYAEKPS